MGFCKKYTEFAIGDSFNYVGISFLPTMFSQLFKTSAKKLSNNFEYLLMHTPNKSAEISFLLPNHPSQQPLFQSAFTGQGMYLTIEVDDVNKIYADLKAKKTVIKIDIRDEPWGDRHFAIQDPNGIGIEIVKYTQQ
jgi:uncharacterized glyoxalase superfamily protein PhnB